MIRVSRANVVLDVEDDEKEKYLALGYDIYDLNNKLIQKTLPTDLGVLQKAYVENKAKIKELEAEIAKLKAEKVEKVSKPVKSTKDELNLDEVKKPYKKSNKS